MTVLAALNILRYSLPLTINSSLSLFFHFKRGRTSASSLNTSPSRPFPNYSHGCVYNKFYRNLNTTAGRYGSRNVSKAMMQLAQSNLYSIVLMWSGWANGINITSVHWARQSSWYQCEGGWWLIWYSTRCLTDYHNIRIPLTPRVVFFCLRTWRRCSNELFGHTPSAQQIGCFVVQSCRRNNMFLLITCCTAGQPLHRRQTGFSGFRR